MTTRRTTPAGLAAVLDLAAVAVFAAVGRSSHHESTGVVAVAEVAAPFALGAAVGWVAHLAVRRRAPVRPVEGLWVLGGAVAVGHVVRALTGAGTAVSFVVVSVIALGVLLLGWRGLAAVLERRRVRIPDTQ